MALNLYHTLSQINKIKKKELILPVARAEVAVYPLSVGDDLILKTALISPVKLDKELMRLLWMHTEFWIPSKENSVISQGSSIVTSPDGQEIHGVPKNRGRKKKTSENERTGGVWKKLPEQEFYNNISYYDKLVLLWGIYSVTYESLGKQEFKCTECGQSFVEDILLDDTMHEDSLTLFEQDIPFNKFTDTITIPLDKTFNLEFTVCIPSMADFNRVLGLLSTQELQMNLEKIKSEFNTEQLMTLYTKKLAVYPKEKPSERSESSVTREIWSSIRDFINIDVSTEFFDQYANKFSMYNVRFYKECECPACHHKEIVEVDPEYEFFRRQLSRR